MAEDIKVHNQEGKTIWDIATGKKETVLVVTERKPRTSR